MLFEQDSRCANVHVVLLEHQSFMLGSEAQSGCPFLSLCFEGGSKGAWVRVQDLLKQLPRLLGQKGVSDTACTRAASCVKLVVQCVASFKPLMLKELEAELHGYALTAPAAALRIVE